MTSSSNIIFCVFAKGITGVGIITELVTLTVVHQENTDVVAHMPVAYDIHIIEEGQVTKNSYEELIGMSKRRSNHGRDTSVNAEATDITLGMYTIGESEKIV